MGKKLTTKEFIKKAKKIHGDKYDYSNVNYINSRKKVEIICSKHGKFQQKANNHLNGSGCIKCGGKFKKTLKIFIENSKKIHGDKYDYSSVKYVNNFTKIEIICSKHGKFQQNPANHLSGQGCPNCGINSRKKKEN